MIDGWIIFGIALLGVTTIVCAIIMCLMMEDARRKREWHWERDFRGCRECWSPIEPDGLQHDPTCSRHPLNTEHLRPLLPGGFTPRRCSCPETLFVDLERLPSGDWYHRSCGRAIPAGSYQPPGRTELPLRVDRKTAPEPQPGPRRIRVHHGI